VNLEAAILLYAGSGSKKSMYAPSKDMGDGEWRTINGLHVFIKKGESPKDAFARTLKQKTGKTERSVRKSASPAKAKPAKAKPAKKVEQAGFVKNASVFHEPAQDEESGETVTDHYVVEPDGSAKELPQTHDEYFAKHDQATFTNSGGLRVTVAQGSLGISFGRKDETTVDKILQVAGHSAFRDYESEIEYKDPSTGKTSSFNSRSVGDLARQLRGWLKKK